MSNSVKVQTSISNDLRTQIGIKVSIVGLVVNLALFALKIVVGLLSGSIAMVADAVNNLSDFASAIIVLISFKISSRPADRNHPFGHARFEYIASAIVAMFILFLGFELGKSSIAKIFNPTLVSISWFLYATLILSMLVKTVLYFYYMQQSKKIDSIVIKATAKDSMSDAIVNLGLLSAVFLGKTFRLAIDGYAGVLMSFFIIYSGISLLRQTTDHILGQRPDRHLKESLKRYIKEKPGVYGLHDLIVHDYGVDNYFATAHVEVDAAEDIMVNHDLLDQIEREVAIHFNINLVLHMDPIDLDNPEQNRWKVLVEKLVRSIDSHISIHDFRIQKSDQQLQLIFDLNMPDDLLKSNEELRAEIEKSVRKIEPNTKCFITIDRNYATETVDIITGDVQQS
ncbi:MAG: cation diffusion facilitator family transporter [Saccharofermentanales bacterium]|jgi:cation diffusion facilitator family transporter